MRWALLLGLVACGGSEQLVPDSTPSDPEVVTDAAADSATGLFGTLSGMCGVLVETDLTSTSPKLVRDTLTFDRAYVDAADLSTQTRPIGACAPSEPTACS